MKIVRSIDAVGYEKNSVITVGTFDGVHVAHQEIIRELVHRARMREGRSVVVTFDPHPKEVVPSARGVVQLLSTVEERSQLLAALHVDVLVLIEFTHSFSRMGAQEFYQDYLVRRVGVSEVVVGYDHMFGYNRGAGIQDLVTLGRRFDFSVFAVHAHTVDGEPVSSTRIRKALHAGHVERARALLGKPYTLSGRVVEGDRRGRSLGFPTANVVPISSKKVVPARGVYFVAAQHMQQQYFGIMNIGVRPTVTEGHAQILEVHLLDFSREIYGEELTVSFLRRLRDEKKFASVDELKAQLYRDKEECLRLVATHIRQ